MFQKLIFIFLLISIGSCDLEFESQHTLSDSGVKKVTNEISVGSDGMSNEQRNVVRREDGENAPGAIKYVYILSAYSGQVIDFSTVKGKVTSSGKRLLPKTITHTGDYAVGSDLIAFELGGKKFYTYEVMNNDGTWGGGGAPYLYWWDQNDVYQQHYITGGTVVRVTSQPRSFGSVTIKVENK